MKKKHPKTNAIRLLEKHGVGYELRYYDVDERDLSAGYVAQAIGFPPPQVFKTLVVQGNSTGILIACIPTNAELDLKELAHVSGNKKVELVPVKEIQSLTGYVRGGVSPVGTKKQYPVYLDESAFVYDTISLSAGVRGCQMLVSPIELANVIEIKRFAIKKNGAQ